jgi:hypothetical protein
MFLNITSGKGRAGFSIIHAVFRTGSTNWLTLYKAGVHGAELFA